MPTKQEEKLFAAIEKDEQLIEEEVAKLITARNRLLNVRIKVPGAEDIVIKARRLRASELAAYRQALIKINPRLLSKDRGDLQLTPEENEKLEELTDRYIEAATGIKRDVLKNQIDDDHIRGALLMGIVQGSSISQEELEDLSKFRPDA